MMESSDRTWNIATPHIKFMQDRLNNYSLSDDNIILSMQYSFTRQVMIYKYIIF
jgi:hypothetical protein